MKAFTESQFGYCSLVWMFYSRSLNKKINPIHERALGITYNDKSSSFQKLLEKDNSLTIHHKNNKILATETGGSKDFEKGGRSMSATMIGHRRKF